MSQLLPYNKFGNGKNGDPSAASGVINTYATMTATAGSQTVTTNLSVDVGDVILLIQCQGTGAGNWELVTVKTTGSGQFTSGENLVYSFTTGAQAVKVPQYLGGTISNNLACNAWGGSTGGIVVLMSKGSLSLTGNIVVDGADAYDNNYANRTRRPSGGGFRGGKVDIENDDGGGTGQQGESYNRDGLYIKSTANDGGGSGADFNDPGAENWAGGGGAYGTNGGASSNAGEHQADGGTSYGTIDLTSIFFGSAGGGNTGNTAGGKNTGGNGAGIVMIFAKHFDCSAGYILCRGGLGKQSGSTNKPGGSGAGGSVLIVCQTAVLGTNRILATGGAAQTADSVTGGAGGDGRIRVNYLISVSGTTNPTLSSAQDTNLKSTIYGGIL